jgi:hypothetical protein
LSLNSGTLLICSQSISDAERKSLLGRCACIQAD